MLAFNDVIDLSVHNNALFQQTEPHLAASFNL